MDRAKIRCKINYQEKLINEAKELYFEKIKQINMLDPYEHHGAVLGPLLIKIKMVDFENNVVH